MKNNEWKEILKKCFGKEKDDRYHAIAMLTIYGIFILILVVGIRIGSSDTINFPSENSSPITTSPSLDIDEEDSNPSIDMNDNDINYSYSYTISYNGVSEVYLGKKIDEKEKFTLVKDGTTTNYAILSDNYLILENGTYHITENPSKFFKYCDIEKILLLVENEISTESTENIGYSVSNQSLATAFEDSLLINNEQTNSIQLFKSGETLKSVDLDFSNYLSSIEGTNVTFTIHMEFVDVGTTEAFEIKIGE